jgi:hypothetical protein
MRPIGTFALCLLTGCSWVLPKPSQPPPTEAVATADAACTLERIEARKARSASLAGLGAAQPLIISLEDGSNADHAIRGGNAVVLRRAVDEGNQAPREQERVPAFIVTVATNTRAHDGIEDQSVVRLRSRSSLFREGNDAGAARGFAPLKGGDYVIFKADTPNPNRPSTCDAHLRDGDFVYLKSVSQNTWVGARNGAPVIQDAHAPDGAPCRTPRDVCYTDRYGGMLCANYFECGGQSGV